MNGSVVQLRLGLEVLIDQVSNQGSSVRKSHGHGRQAELEQVLDEQTTLSCFSTPIDAFKDNEGTSAGGGLVVHNHGQSNERRWYLVPGCSAFCERKKKENDAD